MKCFGIIKCRKKINLQKYIDKGYIDVKDNAVFLKSIDICNLFRQ